MLSCLKCGNIVGAVSRDPETQLVQIVSCCCAYLVFDPTGEIFNKYKAVK